MKADRERLRARARPPDRPGPRPPELNAREVPDSRSPSTSRCWTPPTRARGTGWDRARHRAAPPRYDGFVVLHGTDTMAYTASALAFLLRGLASRSSSPAAQIPLGVLRSDGRQNLLTAVLVAARDDVREVVPGVRLARSCAGAARSRRARPASRPSAPRTCRRSGWPASRSRSPSPACSTRRADAVGLPLALDAPVACCGSTPACRVAADAAMAAPIRGLVLEAYGAGTVPDTDLEVLEALSEGARRGVVVAGVSQCVDGRVDLGAYRRARRWSRRAPSAGST